MIDILAFVVLAFWMGILFVIANVIAKTIADLIFRK